MSGFQSLKHLKSSNLSRDSTSFGRQKFVNKLIFSVSKINLSHNFYLKDLHAYPIEETLDSFHAVRLTCGPVLMVLTSESLPTSNQLILILIFANYIYKAAIIKNMHLRSKPCKSILIQRNKQSTGLHQCKNILTIHLMLQAKSSHVRPKIRLYSSLPLVQKLRHIWFTILCTIFQPSEAHAGPIHGHGGL